MFTCPVPLIALTVVNEEGVNLTVDGNLQYDMVGLAFFQSDEAAVL